MKRQNVLGGIENPSGLSREGGERKGTGVGWGKNVRPLSLELGLCAGLSTAPGWGGTMLASTPLTPRTRISINSDT